MSTVFISYSSRDRDRCAKIVDHLEQDGLNCWVAPRDIAPGSMWMESVTEAIDQCSVVLLLVTAHSNSSQQVRRELERTVSKSKPIVPFVLEEVQFSKWMQYCISIHHWHTSQCSDLKRDLSSVAESLRGFLSVPELENSTDIQSELVVRMDGSLVSNMLQKDAAEGTTDLFLSYTVKGTPSDRVLISVDSDIKSYANLVAVRYGLIQKYTERKSEFGYSSGLSGFTDQGIARILSTAIEFNGKLHSIAENLYRTGFTMEYQITLFPDDSTGCDQINRLVLPEKLNDWVLLMGTPDPNENPEESLVFLSEMLKMPSGVFTNSEFVGREKEISVLAGLIDKQQYWHVENPRGYATHLVAGISGSAGIGKTALVNEFTEILQEKESLHILRGSNATGLVSSGGIWLNLIENILGMEKSEGVSGSVIQAVIQETYGIEVSNDDSEALSFFCSGSKLVTDSEQQNSLIAVQIAVRNLLANLADSRDLLIILEDMHLADEFSMELLRFITANTDLNRPSVFVLTFRPMETQESSFLNLPPGYFNHVLLELEGLAEKEQNTLINNLLCEVEQKTRASDVLLQFIRERSFGNPLFIRELLETTIQQKQIGLKGSIWYPEKSLPEMNLSQGLRSVYNSRLAALPDDRLVILKCLSVLGDQFSLRRMYEFFDRINLRITDNPESFFASLKGFLERRDTVFRRTVMFSHTLLHDHLYKDINHELKSELHLAAAETLLNEGGVDPAETAFHYHNAHVPREAMKWGMSKISRLKGIHDNSGVIKWSELLLEWIPEGAELRAEEFEIRKILYHSCNALGLKEKQKEGLSRLLQLAEGTGIKEQLFEVKLIQLQYLTNTGEMEQARLLLQKLDNTIGKIVSNEIKFKMYKYGGRLHELDYSLDKALEFNEKAAEFAELEEDKALIHHRLGRIYATRGDHEKAMSFFDNAFDTAHRNHWPLLELAVLNSIAQSYYDTGKWDEARKKWESGIKLSRSVGRRKTEASMLNLLGHMLSETDSIREALEMQYKSLNVMEESGNKHGVCKVLLDIGLLFARTGEKDKAQDYIERSLSAAREMNNRGGIAAALANLSSLQKDLGQYEAAEKNILESIEVWHDMDCPAREAASTSNLGSIKERMGKLKEAEECFIQAIALGEKCGDSAGNAVRTGNLAVMMQIQHRWEEAEEFYCEAIRISKETNNARMLGMWTGYLATLNDTLGRRKKALGMYLDSIEILRKTGDELYLSMISRNYSGYLAKVGEYEKALEIDTENLGICQRNGYRVDEASILCSIGHYYINTDQVEQAASYFVKACSIASELKIAVHMFRGIMPLYRVLKKNGFSEADEAWPIHWGDPGEINRDSHRPEEKKS